MSVVNVKVKHIRSKYKDLKEWTLDDQNVYIGRVRVVFIDGCRFLEKDSIWANPYKLGTDRNECINKYKE